MRRGLASLLLFASFGPFVCAQDPIQGLLAKDWRERNAAARTLAAASTLDVDALLKVMQTPEDDEWVSSTGVYGGRHAIHDPIAALLAECRSEAGNPVFPVGRQNDRFPLVEPTDLVIPRTPHQLAAWLLARRAEVHETVRTRWQALQVEPTNMPLAETWLSLLAPSIDDIVASASHPNTRWATLRACAVLQPATLRPVLLRGDVTTQSDCLLLLAGLDKDRTTARGDAELLRVLANCLVQTEQPGDASRLGSVLRTHGVAGLQAALGAGPKSATSRRRVTALAAILAATHPIPIADIAPFLDDEDSKVVERALGALRHPARDAAAAHALAPRLIERLTKTSDGRWAALYLHAIAGLGPDCPTALSATLRGWWDRLPWRGARPSVLLAMIRLGVAGDVPLAAKLEVLGERSASDACRDAVWSELAASTDGGAAALLALTPKVEGRLLDQAASVVAKVDPSRLKTWLAEPTLRMHALRGLAAGARDRLPPFAELQAERANGNQRAADELAEILTEHPAASEHLDDILSAILRNHPSEFGRFQKFLQAHHRALPPERRMELLAEHLPLGQGWWLLQDAPASLVLEPVRQWLAASRDAQARGQLCAQLARFCDPADDERIVAQLAAKEFHPLLRPLATAPQMSAAVRAAVERRIDAELQAEFAVHLEEAFAVLWAHRQR